MTGYKYGVLKRKADDTDQKIRIGDMEIRRRDRKRDMGYGCFVS